MKIQLTKAGKRFNREWIFRNTDLTFLPREKYAITGPNGSGKSTLLQVLSGSMSVSAGSIDWNDDKGEVDAERVYSHLSIAAPYLEVIEEMTAVEFLSFHQKFKPLVPGLTPFRCLQIVGLEKAANKQIRYYSSGMKQRVKLAQAVFADVPLLLLDEPCSNLDASGYDLYNALISNYTSHKTVVVSSNDANEYSFCREIIKIAELR